MALGCYGRGKWLATKYLSAKQINTFIHVDDAHVATAKARTQEYALIVFDVVGMKSALPKRMSEFLLIFARTTHQWLFD